MIFIKYEHQTFVFNETTSKEDMLEVIRKTTEENNLEWKSDSEVHKSEVSQIIRIKNWYDKLRKSTISDLINDEELSIIMKNPEFIPTLIEICKEEDIRVLIQEDKRIIEVLPKVINNFNCGIVTSCTIRCIIEYYPKDRYKEIHKKMVKALIRNFQSLDETFEADDIADVFKAIRRVHAIPLSKVLSLANKYYSEKFLEVIEYTLEKPAPRPEARRAMPQIRR